MESSDIQWDSMTYTERLNEIQQTPMESNEESVKFNENPVKSNDNSVKPNEIQWNSKKL